MAKKLTVQFNETTDDLLSKLADRRGVTKVDVLRRAIALYDYVDKETTGSDKRLSITENGKAVTDIVTT